MLSDVIHYDALGEHRTAGPADDATSDWLAQRLAGSGLAVELQRFAAPLFTITGCRIETADGGLPAFPAWLPAPTPAGGVRAAVARAAAGDVAGRIALIKTPSPAGAGWAPALREPVMAAFARGAAGAAVHTDGPTGEIIALNRTPPDLSWPGPVVLVGRVAADRLAALAEAGGEATFVLAGETAAATASNVIARRPGRGPTLVLSTPKSGWFQCAGERASGIAVFLELAPWLVQETDADLTLVAFSGHELAYRGGAAFLAEAAPAPGEIRAWLHIGANAAMRDLVFDGGRATDNAARPFRRATASEALLPAAQAAFGAGAGYLAPALMTPANALGEMTLVHAAGYRPLAAVGGPNPLFHTRLDRAEVVTTPDHLAAVAGALKAFIAAIP